MGKLFLFILLLSLPALAQQVGETRPWEVSLEGGPLLPSHIPHVTEILLGSDYRVSIPTGKGKFELDGFFANGSGTNYMTFSLAYRYDISLSEIPAFVLIGFNGDFYTPPAPNASSNFSGGWHFGGGFMQAVTGGWSVREDIRYRNGPGTSVLVELGLDYAFSN